MTEPRLCKDCKWFEVITSWGWHCAKCKSPNIPLDSVRHAPAWEVTPEYIKFYDRYFLGDKLVKQSVHVYIPQGVSALAAQGAF